MQRMWVSVLVVFAVLVSPSLALAPKPVAGKFSGKTSQGKVMSFKVASSRSAIKNLQFDYRGSCDIAGRSGTAFFPSSIRIKNGRFSADTSVARVRGTFTSPRKANGTAFVEAESLGGRECASVSLKWSARR